MKTNRVSIYRWSVVAAGVLVSISAIALSVLSPTRAVASGGGPSSPPADTVSGAVVPAVTPQAVSTADGIAAFESVRVVLQHPRCQNCHIPGDAPLQFDEGRAHGQNVKRGPEGKGSPGLACGTCHFNANPPASYGQHVPPGAPNWRLPPPQRKMVFIGLSSAELCRTIKDKRSNGGKDLAALVEHVGHDKLVLWGWNPGAGRDPVSVPHDQFVAKFKQWVDAGAPCAK